MQLFFLSILFYVTQFLFTNYYIFSATSQFLFFIFHFLLAIFLDYKAKPRQLIYPFYDAIGQSIKYFLMQENQKVVFDYKFIIFPLIISIELQQNHKMDNKTAQNVEHLNLKVKSQDGEQVFFKIKNTTPFKKLMDAYCQRQGLAPNNVRFLFDGERLLETQTPKNLSMENGDEIDVLVEQVGGSA